MAAKCFVTAAAPPPQHEGIKAPLTLRRPWNTAVSKGPAAGAQALRHKQRLE